MENLGLDLKQILAQIINFLIFFLLFSKFVAKPLRAYLDKRKGEDVERERKNSEVTQAHEEMETFKKTNIEQIRKQEQEIFEKARTQAEAMRQEIIAKAHTDAEQIVTQAKANMQLERRAAEQEIAQHVETLSVKLVQDGLKYTLSPDVQKNLTQYIINNAKA